MVPPRSSTFAIDPDACACTYSTPLFVAPQAEVLNAGVLLAGPMHANLLGTRIVITNPCGILEYTAVLLL
jgi:hypothetical protein